MKLGKSISGKPATAIQQVHAHEVLQCKAEQVGHLLLRLWMAHDIEGLLEEAQQAVAHVQVIRLAGLLQ